MSTTTPNLGLTVPAMGDQISSTIPALGTNFQTLDNKFGILSNSVSDIITIKPSGNATTDTTNIQNAINSARVVKLQNKKDSPFLINAPIVINSIDETTTNGSTNGRVIDLQNCTIQATNNIANVFQFQGAEYPSNNRNITFKNVLFDGTVTDAFVYVNNSWTFCVDFENIFSTYNATADSLVRFENTDVSGQHQGGLTTLRHIRGMNNIQNTVRFSKVSGANSLFDDFIIEDISSRYIGSSDVTQNLGNCIKVDDGCILTVSLIQRLFTGGYGYLISLGSGSSIMDSTIRNLYAEPLGNHGYGIVGGSFSNCQVDLIRLYLSQESVTTFARCIYSQPNNCEISQLYIEIPGGTAATGVYYEEIGASAKTNRLSKIGDNPVTRIKLWSANGDSSIRRNYGDPYFYANGGNITSANDNVAKTINLLNIPKTDLDSTNILRIKVKGETNANTANAFKIQLTGTGVSIDLLNYGSTASANIFEAEAEIILPNTTYMYVVAKGIIGTSIISNVGTGTPLHAQVTTPDPLKLVLNITGSNYIGILSVTAEKVNNVLKPLTGATYAQ